ncbi:MAG: O-antigen ligase family protein [Bryobacteraceae bacterium]
MKNPFADGEHVLYPLSLCAAAACMVSIAASHILLGAGAAWLLLHRDRVRIPRVWLPILVFLAATLAAAAFSPAPAAAWPQIRKFYVWLFLPVVYSGVRRASEASLVLAAMAVCGTASALWGLAQFEQKYVGAAARGEDFYQSYVAERITGFMSHWMTFSSHVMFAFLAAVAFLLLARNRRAPVWIFCGGVTAVALVLGFTRSIWPAAAAGMMFLVWHWRRWFVLATPVAIVALVLFAPEPLNRRIESAWKPSKLDSNDHRQALRRTGLRMIEAHPLVGVGPEQVGPRFLEFAPPDVPRPLPSAWYTQHLHNIYIHFAAERGVPAAVGLVWFLALVAWQLGRGAAGVDRAVPLAAVAAIIGTAVGGYWEVNLGDSEVLGALLSMIACGYAVRDEEAAA